MHTQFCINENVKEQIQTCIKELILEFNNDVNLLKISNSSFELLDDYHFVILRDLKNLKKIINNMALSYALKSENIAANSFKNAYLFSLKFAHKLLLTNKLYEFKDCVENLNLNFLKNAEKASFEDCNKIIKNITSKLSYDLFVNAINLAGIECSILIDNHKTKNSIELINGYNFPFKCEFKLEKSLSFKEAKTLIVDGRLENVSELHKILDHCSNNNDKLVIFSRGYSDEVLLTLKTNFNRGTLCVIPILVPGSVEHLNSINDIAMVVGSDIISSLKGDLIVCLDPTTFISVDKIEIKQNAGILITNDRTKQQVKTHLQHLIDVRDKQRYDELSALYDQRIKSLNSSYVCIRVTDDDIKTKRELDIAIRTFKNIITHGIINFDKLSINNNYLYDTITTNNIKSRLNICSTKSLISSVNFATKFAEQIYNLGSVVCNA